jgi:MSHA pilin protein MshC
MAFLAQFKNVKRNGFTMIELIVVIIIIAIMSTTVIPKFFTSTGFQEYTYQAEIITKLRSIQLRAMQQTNSSECHTVLVTESALGIPETCTSLTLGNWQNATTSVIIESGHDVTFDVSSGNYSLTFDSMGRPNCSPCLITVLGDSTLTIKIESEGYIHEG